MPSAESMHFFDYVVLVLYFVILIGIGVWTSRKIHKQVDFFMGGRSFGKLLQTFAAFGAGTGSSDPVTTARTSFVSGLSGMWSVMYWLFVTPFYWITGVWYRRMRHLTLGDWFVERYESQALGLGYCIFGLGFFMVYGSMMFSAIGKVAAPLTGIEMIPGTETRLEFLLVPLFGLIVLIYGVLGGLEAAYFTDLIQGICIIVLSIMLIPFGLQMLVHDEYLQAAGNHSLLEGFSIMHQRLPDEFFSVIGITSASEFPWYRIAAIVLINLVGIVIQPHFIATGGGSAKTEMNARVGLVTGNFLKRFCTIGWVLTALIIVALFGANPELNADPDKTWGFASLKLLPVGLKGLMLACLLAALMSSADAYMVVGSALVVRNIYAPYINANATEKEYVFVGRLTGAIVILGAVVLSLSMMNVFKQLQLTWIFGVLFAAPFWIGMYWRRATTLAAWITVAFNGLFIFLLPLLLPIFFPALRGDPAFWGTSPIEVTTSTRPVSRTDVDRRYEWQQAYQRAFEKDSNNVALKSLQNIGVPKTYLADDAKEFKSWAEKYRDALGDKNMKAIKALGMPPNADMWDKLREDIKGKNKDAVKSILRDAGQIEEVEKTGGKSVFWSQGVIPVDENGKPLKRDKIKFEEVSSGETGAPETKVLRYAGTMKMQGNGDFKIDFLLYRWMGLPLESMNDAQLATLDLPTKIVLPFLVMIFFSFITPRNTKFALDRYYAKMKTPVDPDPEIDQQKLEATLANPEGLESKKLFPGTALEFQKPRMVDIIGVVVSFILCFVIIGLAVLVASIGS